MMKALTAANMKSSFGHMPQIIFIVLSYDFATVCYCSFHFTAFLPQQLDNVDVFLSIFGYNAVINK